MATGGRSLQELSKLYWLRKQVEEIERRERELKATYSRNDQAVTGAQRYVRPLERVQTLLVKKRMECLQEEAALREYIYTIPDVQVQTICTLRFVCGLSWQQIATDIGGGNTEDSVKKICYRWMKANSKKEK